MSASSASVALAGGGALLVAAILVLAVVTRSRRRVRRISWLLSRTAAAIAEAERAGRLDAELSDTP